MKLEYDFDHAITHQEFIGSYQPLIDCNTDAVIVAYVLACWKHPKLLPLIKN